MGEQMSAKGDPVAFPIVCCDRPMTLDDAGYWWVCVECKTSRHFPGKDLQAAITRLLADKDQLQRQANSWHDAYLGEAQAAADNLDRALKAEAAIKPITDAMLRRGGQIIDLLRARLRKAREPGPIPATPENDGG